MPTATSTRKLLSVRATVAEQRLLTKAAARTHRSLNSFVLSAALEAARTSADMPATAPLQSGRRSLEEVRALLRTARAEVQAKAPTGHDLLEEFLNERRAVAALE